jgi:hypothetical protein
LNEINPAQKDGLVGSDEDRLSCFLLRDIDVIDFCQKLTFETIKKAISVGFPETELIGLLDAFFSN